MIKKHKLLIIGLIALCTLFLLIYFFPNIFISYRKVEGNVSQQISEMVRNEGNYRLSLNGKKCYWIRPTHNGTHFLIEVTKHNTTDSCYGLTLDRKKIVMEEALDIKGKCVCGNYCDFKVMKRNETKYLEMVECKV
ncbi:MAG: hypothetical protein ABEK36_00730 [Candidatus Aenigmatarchaeota archaeon]